MTKARRILRLARACSWGEATEIKWWQLTWSTTFRKWNLSKARRGSMCQRIDKETSICLWPGIRTSHIVVGSRTTITAQSKTSPNTTSNRSPTTCQRTSLCVTLRPITKPPNTSNQHGKNLWARSKEWAKYSDLATETSTSKRRKGCMVWLLSTQLLNSSTSRTTIIKTACSLKWKKTHL